MSIAHSLELADFVQACSDWGKMGTGQFLAKYPDYDPARGYEYIEKRADAILRAAGRKSFGSRP